MRYETGYTCNPHLFFRVISPISAVSEDRMNNFDVLANKFRMLKMKFWGSWENVERKRCLAEAFQNVSRGFRKFWQLPAVVHNRYSLWLRDSCAKPQAFIERFKQTQQKGSHTYQLSLGDYSGKCAWVLTIQQRQPIAWNRPHLCKTRRTAIRLCISSVTMMTVYLLSTC